MVVVCLNGSINSGKSTVGRLLADRLPGAVFIEGDRDGPGDETSEPAAPLTELIDAAVARIQETIRTRARHTNYAVVAYPLREADYARIRAAAAAVGAGVACVTLAPSRAVAMRRRGERVPSEWERGRIREMYEEGYHARPFSDLVLDNSTLTAEETAAKVEEWIIGGGSAPRANPAKPSSANNRP